MPKQKNSECDEERNFKILSTHKGKVALLVDSFIIIAVIAVLLLIEFGIIPHHHGGYYCNDPKLSFKFQGDTVTITVLLSSVYLIPLIIIGVVEYKSCKRVVRELFRRIWTWYKEFLIGITTMLVLIEFIKVIVGETRPHFFDSCQPDSLVNCTEASYVLSYKCTNTKSRPWFVSDASKSFPSGHAAMSVFAALFTVWYVHRNLPNLICKLLKPFIQTVLLVLCAFCSLSRVTDHRHHWWDVLAGVILGTTGAVYTALVLCRNFKRLSPLPPRSSHSTCTLLTDTTNKNATSVIL